MKTFLKSSTALLLSGAMILPVPLAAQQRDDEVRKPKQEQAEQQQRKGGREENGQQASREATQQKRQAEAERKQEQQAQAERKQEQQAERKQERQAERQAERQQQRAEAEAKAEERVPERPAQASEQAGSTTPPRPSENADARAQQNADRREERQQVEADRQAGQERRQSEDRADAPSEQQLQDALRREAGNDRPAASEERAAQQAEANAPRRQEDAPRQSADEPQRDPRAAVSGREQAENGIDTRRTGETRAEGSADARAETTAETRAEGTTGERDLQDALRRDAGQAPRDGRDAPRQAEADQPRRDEGTREGTREATAEGERDPRAFVSGREQAENGLTREELRQRDIEPSQTAEARDREEPRAPDAEAEARAAARDAEENNRPLAAANPDAQGEVVEQRITEGMTRQSNEDFRTSLRDGTRRDRDGSRDRDRDYRDRDGRDRDGRDRDNRDRADNDRDSGLSNFEKLALFGLGAVAVGSLLDNGDEVVSNTGDRVVVERDGRYRVLKDDDVLIRQPGTDVRTYAFDDGSTRTVALREDGTQVETLRAADGRVLRRTRILPDGREVLLFDDTQRYEAVNVRDLPQVRTQEVDMASSDEMRLRRALETELSSDVNRRFSLSQIRDISAVRALVPEISVDTITFDTGSAAIPPEQARQLTDLGVAMRDAIDDNPAEVFLIEGHTDAVGAASMNLALSDRRAETLALALTEYFDVPPENMVVQGYGESDLKVLTSSAERENRRAAVRRITPLLDGTSTNG